MKKSTQALSVTLALFLTCAGVMAKEPCKCPKCTQEKVQVYAHPSLMILKRYLNFFLTYKSNY